MWLTLPQSARSNPTMATVELAKVATAVLRLKTLDQRIVVKEVVPVEVEVTLGSKKKRDLLSGKAKSGGGMSPKRSKSAAQTGDNDQDIQGGGVQGQGPAAGASASTGASQAYLCLGQRAVYFVDREISDLLFPEVLPEIEQHGIPYTSINCITLDHPLDSPSTFSINLKSAQGLSWTHTTVKVKAAERSKLVGQIQLFWSICHVQTSWRLPTRSNVNIVIAPQRAESKKKAKQGKKDLSAPTNISAAPDDEVFETLGDYMFSVAKVGRLSPRDHSIHFISFFYFFCFFVFLSSFSFVVLL